jgi:transcriptional regulator GlxA family with amidase domain
MIAHNRRNGTAPLHVTLLAIPDAVISTIAGIYDVLHAFELLNLRSVAGTVPFRVQIAGEAAGLLTLASGLSLSVERAVDEIDATDIVIVPSVLLQANRWSADRYPRLVAWLRAMHARGALLCSACSGIFLLAETGLFDGHDATVHFAYTQAFVAAHPSVRIHSDRVLVIAGRRDELVCSGASMAWHDLVLYLIARFAGVTAAQEVARVFALQWHQDGLTPFQVFTGRRDHGDAVILAAQQWLDTHFSLPHPLEEMVARSRLAERTFKRRFTEATGHPPLDYVQRLRIEDAKRRLERTDTSIERIAWQVGYEDPAFFRRLFRRTTGLPPGAYRRRFRVPAFARP